MADRIRENRRKQINMKFQKVLEHLSSENTLEKRGWFSDAQRWVCAQGYKMGGLVATRWLDLMTQG